MQVFVCYPEPLKVAQAMWKDSKRYNKAILELKQILNAIDGVGKGWFNHPVVKMYKEYRDWLECYMNVFKYYKAMWTNNNFYTQSAYSVLLSDYEKKAEKLTPPFLTDEFCRQHARRLYTKSPELYPQFAEYGTSEENWYVIDGQIVKYINGKRIN